MHAGAVALIIVDDGRCEKFDETCVRGGSKARGEGFASTDGNVWEDLQPGLLTMLVKAEALVDLQF